MVTTLIGLSIISRIGSQFFGCVWLSGVLTDVHTPAVVFPAAGALRVLLSIYSLNTRHFGRVLVTDRPASVDFIPLGPKLSCASSESLNTVTHAVSQVSGVECPWR